MSAALTLNVAKITAGLQQQIKNHSSCAGVIKFVERGEYINKLEARTPWVGVYRAKLVFDPRTLGRGAQNWRCQVHIDIVVQAHDNGGEKAEDKLGDALDRVLTALLSDLTFGGQVEMLLQYSIEFDYQRTKSSTLDFQQAVITLIGEVRA